MPNRTPSLDDLNKLSREEWEDICSLICSSLYTAHRVEDHFGKGNGLDSFREIENGVEGWQYRRFNDRLGNDQANKIKNNVRLARDKCLLELKKPLKKFTVIFNINPEPGHKNSRGEIQRLSEVKKWAQEQYNIEFNFKGVSWVLQILMKNPTLKPELFEDINSTIKDVSKALHEELFDIKQEIHKLIQKNPLEGQLKDALATLLKEANTHYQRGIDHESKEDFKKSVISLQDAVRLIHGKNLNKELEGKIFSFLSGVEVIIGYLKDAIIHANQAVVLLKEIENSDEYYHFALGNLAFALYINQDYEISRKHFFQVLKYFENKGNLLEIVRTLSHLLALETQSGAIGSAIKLLDRVQQTSFALDRLLGPTSTTVSSLGVVANLYAEIGVKNQDHTYLNKAVSLYELIEKNTNNQDFKRIWITSKAARARCVWNLDKLLEAEKLHIEVINEAKEFLPKLSIDTKFNLALLLSELKRMEMAIKLLEEVIVEYGEIGDYPSIQDATKMLIILKNGCN